MSAPAAAELGRISRIDRTIDRLLALAGDGPDSDARARLRVFELILLLHLTTRFATGPIPTTELGQVLRIGLPVSMACCLALSFVARLAPIAVAVALCLMLGLLSFTFPATGNHFYLELWTLSLLLIVGRSTKDDSALLLAALRWSIAIVIFYTGIQKMRYGTYFDAQYLVFEMTTKASFATVFGPLVPAEELARIQALRPNVLGAGPFRTSAPLMLLASNAVYLFEIAIPALMIWRPARRLAVAALLVFVVAIQSGAKEMYFGGLLVNFVLLFWPTDLHRRWLWAFVAYYAVIAWLHYAAPGGLVLY
jgi:hypothetical protein